MFLILSLQASVKEHKVSAARAAAQVCNLKSEVEAAREVLLANKAKAKQQKRELQVGTGGIYLR